ncbi:replication/maintenance protein RepL [Borrelia sp. RT1S]|uniref:replication/maintenance protein RepL n=1 Tax=Borrelia sp. RT1S TaxID=2898580 RepID=UPI001E586B69|nr:replication/maintenance protein RepL [Borrelia sp. RT1S]UGQ17694.1 replication/maintenance protein RepL [Borrelia sp. RT1S]
MNRSQLGILDKLKFDIQFVYMNFIKIVGALLLVGFNILNSYNGFIVYSSEHLSRRQRLLYLGFTIVVIVVPTIIFHKMLYLLNEYRIQKQTGSVTVMSSRHSKVVGVLLIIAFVTQLVSTWGSYENFFQLFFSSQLREVKQQQLSMVASSKVSMQAEKTILNQRIDMLKRRIEANIATIESVEVKNLALYHDHKTKKLEYEKFIDKKNKENKQLEVQINSYLEKVKELDIKHHESIKDSNVGNNMYGIHALFLIPEIFNSEHSYIKYLISYLLLLCSFALDVVFCIFVYHISSLYKRDYESRLAYTSKEIVTSMHHKPLVVSNLHKPVANIERNPLASIASKFRTKKVDFNSIPVDVYKTLDFFVNNTKEDNRVLKKVELISKQTGVSIHYVRKGIETLLKHNLLHKKHRAFVLNYELITKLVDDINNNGNDKSEVATLKKAIKAQFAFVSTIASVSILTKLL